MWGDMQEGHQRSQHLAPLPPLKEGANRCQVQRCQEEAARDPKGQPAAGVSRQRRPWGRAEGALLRCLRAATPAFLGGMAAQHMHIRYKTRQMLGLWSLRKLTIERKTLVLRNETLTVLQYVAQV